MASLSGILQRPITAAAAFALAVSADLPFSFRPWRSSDSSEPDIKPSKQEFKSWVSVACPSKLVSLSFPTEFRVAVPNVKNHLAPISNLYSTRSPLFSSLPVSISSNPSFVALYRAAESANAPSSIELEDYTPLPPTEVMYKWHLPKKNVFKDTGDSECSSAKSRTVVVLLGWLGAKQKHLKRYADWYTERGYHAITFTFPMAEILSYKVGGKTEEDINMLVNHLADWLEEEHGKNLVFHTFSNTGWLTYGVILEKFRQQDVGLTGKIKGCIVDSAPAAAPDPRVWASGFSAALLKKQSIATKGAVTSSDSTNGVMISNGKTTTPVTETALLAILEKFFGVVLNLPKVNRRLSDVVDVLSVEQPKCAQLYIYSSADKVIPSESVESFIEKQRKTGREVRACNFISTPHVDHFRNDPNLYSSQLTTFLEDCVLTCCKPKS